MEDKWILFLIYEIKSLKDLSLMPRKCDLRLIVIL